jgi:hypothetical protein
VDNQLLIQLIEELDIENTDEKVNDEAISRLLADWVHIKTELEVLYRNRDQKSTIQGMKKGIGLFIQFLCWGNEKEINLKDFEPLERLEIKPVNLDERLGFIIRRPNLYHSYRQLSELMVEQEKLYAKKNIVKKRLGPKG